MKLNINQRIEKLKPYFGQFNIVEDMVIVTMKFPEKWLSFDYKGVMSKYGVVIEKQNGQLYFFNDLNADPDVLFDAIDEVVKFNAQIEAKTKLLVAKTKELKDLFMKEDISVLETLSFTFDGKKKGKKKKDTVVITPLPVENVTEKPAEAPETVETVEAEPLPVKVPKRRKSSLMALVEEEVNNQ